MRADARQNYSHILAVARQVILEQGADASLRDIARRAEVGLGTLYRHFPTRESLLEVLLRASLEELTREAGTLAGAPLADGALVSWLRAAVAFVHHYHGIVTLLATAMDDPDSALHAACVNLRSAGALLLRRAQDEGLARPDIDGEDLFALIGALGWVGDQPSFASRSDRLFDIVVGAILKK